MQIIQTRPSNVLNISGLPIRKPFYCVERARRFTAKRRKFPSGSVVWNHETRWQLQAIYHRIHRPQPLLSFVCVRDVSCGPWLCRNLQYEPRDLDRCSHYFGWKQCVHGMRNAWTKGSYICYSENALEYMNLSREMIPYSPCIDLYDFRYQSHPTFDIFWQPWLHR